MQFEQMVKSKEKELLKQNFSHLRNNLNSTEYLYKINNYCSKYGFDTNVIKERIMNDDIIASFFIKDPFKQNFIEELIAVLLKVKKIPQSGKNCIRFNSNGDICSMKTAAATKAVDFILNDRFITQKYTRGTGGAQDNQFQDVVNFLDIGSKKNKVGALVDGSYWDEKRVVLKEYYSNNPNVKILSMDDILDGGMNFE